jgi:Putative peptidoglycan binding domain
MKRIFVGAWLVCTCLPVCGSESLRGALRPASPDPVEVRQSTSSSTSTQSSTSTAHSSTKKKATTKKKRPTKREPAQMAPTSDRVSEIQSALARGGYYKAEQDGKWNADIVDALQKFQSANGLDVTGKLDALTLQKLGLGSDVAGYSAPKGIVSHSCCSMTPSPSHAPPPTPAASVSGSASSASVSQPSANLQPSQDSPGAASSATETNTH